MATVKYEIVPILRYGIQRHTKGDEVEIVEELCIVSSIDEARQFARARTEYDRAHPEDKSVMVLNHGDVEIH